MAVSYDINATCLLSTVWALDIGVKRTGLGKLFGGKEGFVHSGIIEACFCSVGI
jgi:hypothetical protein